LLLACASAPICGQEFERWYLRVAGRDPVLEQELDAAVRLLGGSAFRRDDSGAGMYVVRRPGTLDLLERLDRRGLFELLLVGDLICPFLADTCEKDVDILVYFDPAAGEFVALAGQMTAAVEQLGGAETSRDEPHVAYRLPPEGLDSLPDIDGTSWSYDGTLVSFPDFPPDIFPMRSMRVGERGRFHVSVAFSVAENAEPRDASARLLTVDGAAFTFFDDGNPEVFVKILDGCDITGSYWLFVSGLTDLATETTLLDFVTGRTWVFRTRAGEAFSPILDLTSLDVCAADAAE
jgi:hypothetical protein